jgi:hypothetical protein
VSALNEIFSLKCVRFSEKCVRQLECYNASKLLYGRSIHAGVYSYRKLDLNTSVDIIKCTYICLFDVKYYRDVRQEINIEVRGLTNA